MKIPERITVPILGDNYDPVEVYRKLNEIISYLEWKEKQAPRARRSVTSILNDIEPETGV